MCDRDADRITAFFRIGEAPLKAEAAVAIRPYCAGATAGTGTADIGERRHGNRAGVDSLDGRHIDARCQEGGVGDGGAIEDRDVRKGRIVMNGYRDGERSLVRVGMVALNNEDTPARVKSDRA